ncbi:MULTISPECIES: hypothetical protein [unclassified Pseudomonas]|uniref:hypothetical protein n=1 Tax=unclassified Pseudomonas TaxID=196821 RepID=UPI0024491585|nr:MULTISPECIES: hypothetical protein [unclassified Pseudomonas]MDG9928516.1 hypothetical protein [Pseudomonas sp. GD04042]MDH0482686.1 hypothetical protein [Pseudomonas sp. GD04015]MDH0604612.1 hypothetical protein [Pseudomonas sp. GD03869]
MAILECVNCPGRTDHSTADCPMVVAGQDGDYALVPYDPTPEMVAAAEEAHMPFGDMSLAVRMAVLAAPVQPADCPDDYQPVPVELLGMAVDLLHDLRSGSAVERRLRALLASRAAAKLPPPPQPSPPSPHHSGGVTELVEALEFYAQGNHLLLADPDAWDTCSGEPLNFLHDEAGTASVEDGSIAKAALAAYRGQQGEGERT